MKKKAFYSVLALLVGVLGANTSFADNCTDAYERITQAVTQPPATGTGKPIEQALKQCPDDPKLFLLVGDYYDGWSKKAAIPEDQSMFNYLATEYYAEGIKSGKGDEVKELRYRLAALESDTGEVTAVSIRSIKPGVRLNVRVFFEFNSYELTSGAQNQLDILGNYLAEDNTSRIILEGHTDMAGEEAYNAMLSLQRAESAKQYLVGKFKIAPETIETHGYGFDRLANVDDPYSSKNRRVRVRKFPR